jgi:hypothetical protein
MYKFEKIAQNMDPSTPEQPKHSSGVIAVHLSIPRAIDCFTKAPWLQREVNPRAELVSSNEYPLASVHSRELLLRWHILT